MNELLPALSQESLTSLELRIQAVQRIDAGQWWNFGRVISPFSRLYVRSPSEYRATHGTRQPA
jgi:hypothetical protein